MLYKPHNYQQVALKHILKHPKSGLFLEMGLGKTVVVLTAIDILLMASKVKNVLIIAPLRVAQSVWSQEGAKWDHLKHLTFSQVLGDQVQRGNALRRKADIHIINRENIPWLQTHYKTAWPFDMVVYDESSSFKDGSSKRFRAMKINLGRINWEILLTGTPIGNGLMDLWSQIYLLDQGERLYDTVTQYRMRYFHNPEWKWIPVKGAEEVIYEKLQGPVISMKNTDYLDLPERIDVTVPVKFGPDLQKRYDKFERDSVMAMGDVDITAFNSGALSIKLLQFANGAIYDEQRQVHPVHDSKIEALQEIIDSAGGKPVLVFYTFQHDQQRILSKFPEGKTFKNDQEIQAWNRGEISLAVVHPASAGHGLNLQECANIIVWFGLTWSLELYMQANARLHRQGQKQKVYIYHIVAQETMDQDVMKAIVKKQNGQDALMEAVKAKVDKYKKEVLI